MLNGRWHARQVASAAIIIVRSGASAWKSLDPLIQEMASVPDMARVAPPSTDGMKEATQTHRAWITAQIHRA
jgi:hypothetical protein